MARTADQAGRIETVRQDLTALSDQMRSLVRLDSALVASTEQMAHRAETLVALTDAERQRQQGENGTLVTVLTSKDAALEKNQVLVSALRDLREAISAVELNKTRIGRPVFQIEFDELDGDIRQLNEAGTRLQEVLRKQARDPEAAELAALLQSYRVRSEASTGLSRIIAEGFELTRATQSGNDLIVWSDRLIRENRAQQQSLQSEVASLIRNSVTSNEAELTAQSLALAALRLAQQSTSALARRSIAEASSTVREGAELARRAHSLAMPASIRGGMSAAIEGWREQLAATVAKLGEQNALIADMDRRAMVMSENARALAQAFIEDADRFGTSIRRLLLAGTAGALLIGTAAVFGVARSITRPLRRLQDTLVRATTDPAIGHVALATRRDELGDIARASNAFLAELRHREEGWRDAARRADEALTELRRTQDDLIRAEKLASLGQLVAGVSHEISTPLGIALTTATQVEADSASFEQLVEDNRLSRSRLLHYAGRMREGSRLVTANLMRASNLIHSFKQVAVDQLLEERREIDLGAWIEDLLRSLRALTRPGRHEILAACPPSAVLDTYPGLLAQVLTNAIKNAIDHGLRDRQGGRVTVTVTPEPERMTIEIADDGVGIEPDHLGRVFDPFFTTARSRGGTGLGLHIVHNLVVSRLGGSVALRSEPGRGTVLRLQLPRRLG
ncbi:sensor histidine kinase [Methylobacterium radiodurans]|uniref:sensor histidine kinase n=1 Tax=Methylobacterium radiodurans TaxID=2202828 RepID=UPI001FE5E9B4|nr:HAMP domain-containing sensor histidine kinase [Methylobacterium radiodurans]